ncbi:MAG: hypothetical protein ACR2QH_08730 [Geminicoccaceae bacterium]
MNTGWPGLSVLAGASVACWAFIGSIAPVIGADQTGSTQEELDYQTGIYSPLHFKPLIETTSDEQCLACHQDILGRQVLQASPAGVTADEALGWYQTLDTYEGEQATFHQRHITTPYADKVMNLQCNFCHQGHDPREEAPIPPVDSDAGFTLRKMVNPEETCLLCHGTHPYELMELPGPWTENRQDFEFEESDNGCLACHGEGGFRSVRHQVNYLNADAIEEAALEGSDVCYGCHGGRAWYRISYPYPRHPWPDMPEETPDWAVDRPTESATRFLTDVKE